MSNAGRKNRSCLRSWPLILLLAFSPTISADPPKPPVQADSTTLDEMLKQFAILKADRDALVGMPQKLAEAKANLERLERQSAELDRRVAEFATALAKVQEDVRKLKRTTAESARGFATKAAHYANLDADERPMLLDCTGGVDTATAQAAQSAWAKFHKLETKVTYKLGKKNVEMTFNVVPASKYLRGSTAYDDEKPARAITIDRSFLMAESEVTQAQWKAVMGEGNNPSKWKGDDLPVEQVTWKESKEFAEKLSRMIGKPVRLPTEAEWELAARGGTTTEYFNGDGKENLDEIGWFGGNSGRETHPVKRKLANAWGLHDTAGNVWEWCSDVYDSKFYEKSKDVNPSTDLDNTTDARVCRGGSWVDSPNGCRASSRFRDAPGARVSIMGLRVVFCLD